MKTGLCICYPDYAGEDCSVRRCPNDCSGNGECLKGGFCKCYEGFIGYSCKDKACPGMCLGRGFCNEGKCICKEGYGGPACEKVILNGKAIECLERAFKICLIKCNSKSLDCFVSCNNKSSDECKGKDVINFGTESSERR